MLKILQARLQQYMNHERSDVQAGFRKGRGTRDQTDNIHWIIEKAREFQKNIYFCFIDYTKALTVWIKTNSGKFFKRWEYQTTWPASWEICMQVKKQQLELDMEQQSVSKLGKLSSGHRTGKGHFSFQSQRKAMPENAQTTAELHSSHRPVK